MIKNKIIKRFLLVLSCLFIAIMIWLFPTKSKDDIPVNNEINNNETIIYLKDKNGFISRVTIFIKDIEIGKRINEITNYITIGSNNSNYLKKDFSPMIPQGTRLLSFDIKNDLLSLNFSREFLNYSIEDEKKLFSCLIYTYTSLKEINKISIYVDGNLLDKLPYSGENLSPILDRSFGINHKYNITSIKDIKNTTIYYLNKLDGYYYYTPITLISNNDLEKMEIIINEMASKTSYQTGLISYLKTARDIDYRYNDNIMSIALNKELFNSLNDSNLLETVIYSMNLSIKDNYDVKEVIYLIDTNIYKSYYI